MSTPQRALRRPLGALAAFSVALTGLTFISLGVSESPVSANSGTVTGKVFQDLDVDGVLDGTETGAAGATVKAYDAAGALVGTATTAGDGTYTLNVTGASTSALRVEFSLDRWSPSFFGPDNGGNVQFVDIGATNVNHGVQQPGQFCINNNVTEGFSLAVATMVPGGIQTGSNLPQTGADVMGNCYRQSVSTYPWDGPAPVFEEGSYVNQRTPSQLTRNLQTGAMFGLGYDGGTGLLWGSAVIRRHSGLGPKGVGGVYAMRTDGSGVAASFDLTQAPWSLTLSDGRNLSDAARDLSTNPNANLAYSSDVPGYSAVGKIGIGELEVDVEGGYLWIVNLYEKKLHRIVLTGSTAAPGLGAVTSYTIPQNVCSIAGSVARPFALRLDPTTRLPLVGGVCTNEAVTVDEFSEPENGWVMTLDPANSTFTTLTTFDFDYPHYADKCDGTQAALVYPINGSAVDWPQCVKSLWKGWTDDYDAIYNWAYAHCGGPSSCGPGNDFPVEIPGEYAQPMFTGLDVLADGSLVAGVADRMNFQTGWFNAPPNNASGSASSQQYQITAAVSGDILLLCKTGASTYVRESDGGCGTSYQAASRPWAGPAAQPPLREFFDDNIYGIWPTLSTVGTHIETSNGAVQVWPRSGTQQVAFTAMDPAANLNAGGIRWVSPTTGDAISGVDVTSPQINGEDTTNGDALFLSSSFAKNANMGGLEILCDMAPAEIGNRVWIDSNMDGLQDPGEPIAAGVTVRLYDAAGTLVGTTVTDAQGRYYFRSTVSESATGNADHLGPLPLGTGLQIRFDNPADYAPGGPLHTYGATLNGVASTGGALAGASNSNAVQTGSYPFIDVPAVGSGTVEHTYDAGFIPVRSIGSRAWIDADGNGIQDPSESGGGLGGVLVELFNSDGTPVFTISGGRATVTTSADGTYVLSGLLPGTYKIKFTPPPGIPMTSKNAAGSTSANDSNADPDTGWTDNFTLGATASGDTVGVGDPNHLMGVFSNPTIDVGVIATPVGFGDWVWWDPVGTGDQWTNGWDGIQGVRVELFTPDGQPAVDFDGNPVEPQYTDKYGEYYFTNLLPGQYKAKFTAPSFYVPTARFFNSVHGPSKWDSNIDAQGWTDAFTIAATATGDTVADNWIDDTQFMNFTIDAGYTAANLPVVAIGDYVWFDSNRNGVQDAGERPVEGMWVGLYDVNGNRALDRFGNNVDWQQTGADGKYLFDDLMPGAYRVAFWKDGYLPTMQTVTGSASGVDSNPSTTPQTVRGQTRPIDYNGNPIASAYLTPLETVDGLVSGDTVADTDPNTNATFVNPTVDAGFIPLVALSNFYWYDDNGDGVRDGGEDPVQGGVVHLLNADGTQATYPDGTLVPPTTTNGDGYFEFTGLFPGEYRLRFEPEPGWAFTRKGTDPTDEEDSNVDPATGITDVFTIADDEVGATYSDAQWNDYANAAFYNPSVGAGLVRLVAVGNFTWIDTNRNGVQDPGEPVLAGVKVELFDANGDPALDAYGVPVPPVFTNSNGLYLFDGLLPGDYMIKFTAPGGYLFTTQYSGAHDDDSDASDVTGWTDVFTIEPGVAGDTVADTDQSTRAVFVNPTIDAGFIRTSVLPPVTDPPAPPSSADRVLVGGYVWIDRNGNGLQDPDEAPIPGVELVLRNMDGNPVLDIFGAPVGPQTTDANGAYLFDHLPPGRYQVFITYPSGFGPTREGAGDGVGDSRSFVAVTRALTKGESDLTLDFGVVPLDDMRLPAAGSQSGALALWAAALLSVGLVLGLRRRSVAPVNEPPRV